MLSAGIHYLHYSCSRGFFPNIHLLNDVSSYFICLYDRTPFLEINVWFFSLWFHQHRCNKAQSLHCKRQHHPFSHPHFNSFLLLRSHLNTTRDGDPTHHHVWPRKHVWPRQSTQCVNIPAFQDRRRGHGDAGGEGTVHADQGAVACSARAPNYKFSILLPVREAGGRAQVDANALGEGEYFCPSI